VVVGLTLAQNIRLGFSNEVLHCSPIHFRKWDGVLTRPKFVPENPINPQNVLGWTNRMGEPRGGGFGGMPLITNFNLEQLLRI
jgi:hypothetical protein